MDADPNSFTLLGFAAKDLNDVTLTPNRSDRAVRLFQKTGTDWKEVFVQEPWRDSNKLYASIRGIAPGGVLSADLEDFGIAEQAIVKPKYLDRPGSGDRQLNLCQFCVGGAWVDSALVAGEGNSWEVVDATRIGFAIHDGDVWKFIIFKASDVLRNNLWDGHMIGEILEKKLELSSADLILPFLEPKRVITPKGVVFWG